MNATRLTTILAPLLLTTSLVYAQAPAPPAAPAATKPDAPAMMQHMQDNMKAMQDMMAKINATKDPAERQKLMQEHSKAMHAQMQMMGGMRGGQMGKMQGGGMQGGGMMSGDMMKEHQAMQGRMAMMEMMMGQMLQHQEAAQSPPAK